MYPTPESRAESRRALAKKYHRRQILGKILFQPICKPSTPKIDIK